MYIGIEIQKQMENLAKGYGLKRKSWKLLTMMAFLMAATAAGVMAQTNANLVFHVSVPVVALIDIEPQGNSDILLSVPPPLEAGEGMDHSDVRDDRLWLNYSCSRAVNGPLRKVQVQVSGLIPSGLLIKLSASPATSVSGRGMFGTSGTQITLSNSAQTIINGIGGAFTGNGAGNGHQLRYSLEIGDYGLVEQVQNASLQVTYTLVDN